MWKDYKEISEESGFNYRYAAIQDKNCMYLDFREFSDRKKFSALLDSMFTEMADQGITNLIIDLRNNAGGNSDVGDELLQYLSPVPFQQYGPMTIRYSDHLRRSYPKWEFSEENGIYHKPAGELIPLRPNPHRFAGKGPVFLLTGKQTFSSATDFAWAAQYFGAAKTVGEETGGWLVCFGDTISFRMPHSGILYGTSWKKFYGYGATDAHTHGVLPDYPVAEEDALEHTLQNLIQ